MAVNYSEVLKKTLEWKASVDRLHALVNTASLAIIPFETSLATISAEMFLQTKQHGLSFADRACLALGVQRNGKVFTSEQRMALVTLPIKVKLIRNAH